MEVDKLIDLFEKSIDNVRDNGKLQGQIKMLKEDIAKRHGISVDAPLCNLMITFMLGYLQGTEDYIRKHELIKSRTF